MSDVRHFPTGLPNYREIGKAKICGRNKELIDFLAPTLGVALTLNSDAAEINNDVIIGRLKLIESILRNGLPTDDEAEAIVITHAHSEVELLLDAIDADWWLK